MFARQFWAPSSGLSLAAGGVFIAHGSVPNKLIRDATPTLLRRSGFTEQAYARFSAAQEATSLDLDGHAAKARDLLNQANQELKAAAAAAITTGNPEQPGLSTRTSRIRLTTRKRTHCLSGQPAPQLSIPRAAGSEDRAEALARP